MRTPHLRHVRHRSFERTRHSSYLLGWLAYQAARLGKTSAQVFDLLKTQTAEQIAGTPSTPPATAPQNTALPVISGSPDVGTTISVSNGTWTGDAPITYTYQWNVAGTPVSGQTSQTYTVQVGNAGKAITATVTATNSAGNSSATSAPVTATGGV